MVNLFPSVRQLSCEVLLHIAVLIDILRHAWPFGIAAYYSRSGGRNPRAIIMRMISMSLGWEDNSRLNQLQQ
ncbi:MAG: hypothetical protein CNE99_04735 [OM182 bacterium MED-G24]|uniref:Uncharacterized protein n=1 Tax=OM182 bacterium MED-G24 TaxID=1986255 RepID=A0A2A5WTV3_9GAMM|nr:MAG: hypothetical protein CNE99_04735 [OM182 bacterium MED-G24]